MSNKKHITDLISNQSNEIDLQFSDMVINSDVMQVVAALMKKHNIKTRKELAQKLGVTQAYVSKLFSGDKYFNVRFLTHIQNLFDVSFRLITSDELDKLKQKENHVLQLMAISGYFNLFCSSVETAAPKVKREGLLYAEQTEKTTVFSDSFSNNC